MDSSGAAILSEGGSPRLQGLILANNSASQAGGAVHVTPGTDVLVLADCLFVGNNATHLGGALSIQQAPPPHCTLSFITIDSFNAPTVNPPFTMRVTRDCVTWALVV